MTNKELEIRLRYLADEMPKYVEKLTKLKVPKIEMELEVMNMSLMACWVMLGEIAKRLPEPRGTETEPSV